MNMSPAAIQISIHAPAKGATSTTVPVSMLMLFQSTLPRRERRASQVAIESLPQISIHAPAKGATAP